MKKKHLLMAAVVLLSAQMWAYDFSDVCSTGQTLYYNINGFNVSVTYPSTSLYSPYNGFTKPAGDLVIPDTVTYNGTAYPVTSIGDYALSTCGGLTSVTIPNTVTSIGSNAFAGCIGLTLLTIPNSVTSIGTDAFTYVKNVVYNGTATGSPWGALTVNGYTEGYFIYYDNTKTALKGCSTQATGAITVPNSVISIGDNAFYGCSGLTSVTMGDSVISIGDYAFYHCTGLSSITLGNSVTSIGNYAFAGCSSLNSIDIPNSVISLQANSFHGTGWMGNQPDGGILYLDGWCLGYKSWTQEDSLTINEGTRKIANYAFRLSSSLISVTLPNSLVLIGNNAFEDCDMLHSITLSDSLTYIGNNAFKGCYNLHSLTIPSTVTFIGSNAFETCWGLVSIVVDSGNTVYDSRNNCKAIIETNTNTLVVGCKATVIPNSVTTIGDYAFSNCYGLTSINIPSSVTSIGYSAFGYCYGLTSIAIPNSVVSLGDYVFDNCTWLASISIGKSITIIKKNYFQSCSRLASITLPDDNSLTTIEAKALSNTLWYSAQPAGIVYLGNWCLGYRGNKPSGNKALKEGTKGVADEAFMQCTGLNTFTLPTTIQIIGNKAFCNCINLNTLKVKAAVPPTIADNEVFAGVDNNLNVNVPCGSASAYQSAQYWNGFTNISEEVMYNLVCKSNHTWLGSVEVVTAASCDNGGTATIKANHISVTEARFVEWGDGITDNPRMLVLTQDTTMTAIFESLTAMDENGETAISVHPNPTEGVFTIEANDITVVEVFDQLGQKVLTDHSGSPTVSAAALPAGVYLLKVETATGTKYGKMMRR